MTVALDMGLVLAVALHVHAAGVPIPFFRHGLGGPVRPDAELRVAKPLGALIGFLQGFPRGRSRAGGEVSDGRQRLRRRDGGPAGERDGGERHDDKQTSRTEQARPN